MNATSQEMPKLLALARLSQQAQRRANPMLDGASYLALLEKNGLTADACRLLPFLMTPRQAIEWGCLCAWHVGPARAERDEAELAAAFRWVTDPEPLPPDTPRRRSNLRTPTACLAAAARWAATPDAPPLLPARLVLAAVVLASVQHEPMRYAERCRDFLAIGKGVARGDYALPSRVPSLATSPGR